MSGKAPPPKKSKVTKETDIPPPPKEKLEKDAVPGLNLTSKDLHMLELRAKAVGTYRYVLRQVS